MKFKILFFLILILKISSYGQSRSKLLHDANICISKENYEDAEILIKKSIEVSDTSYEKLYLMYSNLGTMQRRNGKRKDALKSYDIAFRLNPNSTGVLNNRASLKRQMKDFNGSIEDCNLLLEIDSIYEEGYVNRSLAYKKMGDTISAIKDLETLLRIKPKSIAGRNNFAEIKKEQAMYTESLLMLDELISEEPFNPLFPNNKAEVYIQLKDFEKALINVNKAIQIKKSYDIAYMTRGEIYLNLGEFEKAKKDLQKAVKLGCDNEKLYKLLEECK